MRRKVKNRNVAKPDYKYKSAIVGKLINYVMERGKKSVASDIVYRALDIVKTQAKREPTEVFEEAMRNTSPQMEVRSRRIGGANYQVPREVREERKAFLGMNWIVNAALAKKGKPMHIKLAEEIMAAAKKEGEAVRKRENVHKMAESNKAFAHFAW
ncbi:MAG: 30S ribosomal protein S7 [Parcubacteria group bacterium RIFCSPHIGHO2_01_FULL_45_26]|nr:MAG: 30S ribosomal protein S7 [Parcubacteria group bacterium RIFCSPHIGHO2_01_FULL_45_26]